MSFVRHIFNKESPETPYIGDKIKWCYLGKYEKLPTEYKRLIHTYKYQVRKP